MPTREVLESVPANGSTPCSSRLRFAHFRQLEPVLYACLVLLHLLPIWAFAYVPTQDGPAHLANAMVLKEHGSAQTRYHEFFDVRWEPFPNWTTHLLLAGLLYAFPPLVAHKVLVSLYVLSFAFSFRYFLGSFGTRTRQLAPAGLLFLYNRCFMTGFYNYCLSLVIVFIVLAYCLRRRQSFGLGDALALMGFLWLAYFTHLLGYLLAGVGAAWILATAPSRRWRKIGWGAVGLLPTAWLAVHSVVEPAFLGLREGTEKGLPWLQASLSPEHVWQELQSANQGLFEPYSAWGIPMDFLVLLFYESLFLSMLIVPASKSEADKGQPPRLPIATFALGIGILYVLLPDFLSPAIGFLKARFVILPPLLWLACLRMPQQATLRRSITGFLYILIAMNWILVMRYFSSANHELAEFTSGVSRIGHNRTLFVVQSRAGPQAVSYLEHAANYYCLTTHNVNLDNYQAELKHFPVKFRTGLARGRGSLSDYVNRELVDLVLIWDTWLAVAPELAESYQVIYQGERLVLLERVAASSPKRRQEESNNDE